MDEEGGGPTMITIERPEDRMWSGVAGTPLAFSPPRPNDTPSLGVSNDSLPFQASTVD